MKKNKKGYWGLEMTRTLSRWEARTRDSAFQSYKNVQIGEDRWESQINHEDKELSTLKKNYGDDVDNSVITGLMELEEYNASGRYPIAVPWNFEASRQASLKEVVAYLGDVITALALPETARKRCPN